MSTLPSIVSDRVAGFAPPPRKLRGRHPNAEACEPAVQARGLGVVRALLHEPLLHFLVAGGLLFGIAEGIEHYRSQYRIVVSAEDRTRIAETYRQQYGSLPGDRELDTLLHNFVKEEILYREALALGLERGDEIVRRRLAQKITFLQQDLGLLETPTEDELRRYYAAHRDRYTERPRRSLTQIYFSPDAGGDDVARTRAERALPSVLHRRVARAPELGDAFPGSIDLVDVDQDIADRLFGRNELNKAIFTAPIGDWAGPFRSGYGWHLIRVTSERPGRELPFGEVRERVEQNYLDSRRGEVNQAAFDELARKYQVVEERS